MRERDPREIEAAAQAQLRRARARRPRAKMRVCDAGCGKRLGMNAYVPNISATVIRFIASERKLTAMKMKLPMLVETWLE